MESGEGEGEGDYPPLRSWKEVNSMVWTETLKLWRVAGPLALQIMCHFGIESLTTAFVGHIGNLELSAVSVSLSIIGTFTFGFLVPFLFPLSLSLSLSLSAASIFRFSFLFSLDLALGLLLRMECG